MIKISGIKKIKAREISDSGGKKTVEAELTTNVGKFRASVPSGTSKGKYEAVEAEAKKAVENINQVIAWALCGKSPVNQKQIDRTLIKLDGTKNKRKLGANAVLAVSIAVLRAGAKEKKLPLWKYIKRLSRNANRAAAPDVLHLPKPCILLVEGGLHGKMKGGSESSASSPSANKFGRSPAKLLLPPKLDIQEFMVIPEGKTFGEQFLRGKKIYENLKKILKNKFGERGTKLGMEGAFTPPLADPIEVLDLIMSSARGYNVKIGLDLSGSNIKKGKYGTAFYQKIARDYPILFLEDPFGEEDWQNWGKLLNNIGDCLVVGDDLTVTNLRRIKMAQRKKACNAVIIKPNQIGTMTEAIEASLLAKAYGWKVIVSHRSGETKDDFIADFAVGIGADFIKAGAPSKPERMAKYNRLLKIEKELWQS